MNRRGFLSGLLSVAATALVLPEPRRVYSFASKLRIPGVDEWPSDSEVRDFMRRVAEFGDGSDGDLVVTGDSRIVLTRDMYYRNVMVPGGSLKVDSRGFRLFVSGTLDLRGPRKSRLFT